MDTTLDGRIDVVIFPNGGREILANIPSVPPVPEKALIGELDSFVSKFIEESQPDIPHKFTGIYSMKDNHVSFTFGRYQGYPDAALMSRIGVMPEAETVEEKEPVAEEPAQTTKTRKTTLADK